MLQFTEYEQSYRSRDSVNSEEETTGSFFMGRIILTQLFVVLVMMIVVFVIYRNHGARYDFLSNMYRNLSGRDYTVSEIFGSAKKVMGFLTEPKNKAINQDEAEGAGGEDLIFPRDNASFSPFYLSIPIFKPVVSDRTTSAFGYRINPVTDEYGFHSGLDIAASEGSDIYAAFDGIVEKAEYSAARGNFIFLNSDGGVKTVYCHCSELLVVEGQSVKAGEVIAKVGSTGQATGPHLHFEIRIKGIYYNPAWVLDF